MEFCAQSSGNTLTAFLRYTKHTGIGAVIFYPTANAYKIDPAMVHDNVLLVEVLGSEKDTKRAVARFSELSNLPMLPRPEHQLSANKLIAYWLRGYYQANPERFDWYMQSVSSGYGPFGFYTGCDELTTSLQPPKLLAVQQEAVSPYVAALGELPIGCDVNAPMVEPTLFRSEPGEKLIGMMRSLMNKYGGRAKVLLNASLRRHMMPAAETLCSKGIPISYVKDGDATRILEMPGVMALSAFYDEVDQGKILRGERVLVAITGGSRKAPEHRYVAPVQLAAQDIDCDERIKAIIASFRNRQSVVSRFASRGA